MNLPRNTLDSPWTGNRKSGLQVGVCHFAVKFTAAKNQVCFVLAHQPKSFAWRNRGARPHAWKQVPAAAFEALNGIISICV